MDNSANKDIGQINGSYHKSGVRTDPRPMGFDITYEQQLKNEIALGRYKEDQLQQAVRAAQEANTTKTLFLCNIAHELRTPLNAIIGFSDIIATQLFGPVGEAKYIEYAQAIHESGTYLLRLINELLDVSLIEAGEFSISEDDVDLAECITGSLLMLEGQALKKQICLLRDIPSNLPVMRGDQTRIQQIFTNLIGNAIKFTPQNGTVQITASHLGDGALRVSIADTGIGISMDDLSVVFENFKQVANSLARAHEGAGLGLPLAKQLTERHEGTLEIGSEPGRGTTVWVTFPPSRIVKREDGPARI